MSSGTGEASVEKQIYVGFVLVGEGREKTLKTGFHLKVFTRRHSGPGRELFLGFTEGHIVAEVEFVLEDVRTEVTI